jgi:hypothetical protein
VKEKPRIPEQQWRSANFSFLAVYDAQLVRLGALAERYFTEDPATSLINFGSMVTARKNAGGKGAA